MRITPQSLAFVGRTDEMATLHGLFDEVLHGAPRTLLIEGEAGIGKTTLLDRFLGEVPEARILRAYGDDSETGIRFAAADQLVRAAGVEDFEALHAADHVAVGMALLERLSAAPGEHGTIVVLDDAHLADADSLRALLFCARRLAATAVLIVLIVRGSASEALPAGWIKLTEGLRGERLGLRPLTPADTRALGDDLGVEWSAEAARRLCEHTGGNRSTKTVEFHLSSVYVKTGARSRRELRARAGANELDL